MNKNEKTFASNVDAAIEAAAGSIKYKESFDTYDKAVEAMNGRSKFDPSLTKYVVGVVLDFNPEKMKFGISDIGTNGSSVLVVPAGTKDAEGKVTFNRAMNVYLSTFDKVINVTDATGEPVLNADKSQKTVDGSGNAVWEALNACKTDGAKLAWLKGKTLECVQIEREYGPSNYVEIGGTRTPKGHRLSSLPLFKEL